MTSLLVFAHLLAATVWVGGMFFAHFCLRPAAFEVLEPPRRLPLLVSALARFFRWVALAIGVLWLTGLVRMAQVGFDLVPLAWKLMAAIALVMTVIFGLIAHVYFPQVRAHLAQGQIPEAAARLGLLRRWVAVNLALGILTLASASLA